MDWQTDGLLRRHIKRVYFNFTLPCIATIHIRHTSLPADLFPILDAKVAHYNKAGDKVDDPNESENFENLLARIAQICLFTNVFLVD